MCENAFILFSGFTEVKDSSWKYLDAVYVSISFVTFIF